MKGVQCYELFGGIALKIHTFSFFFFIFNVVCYDVEKGSFEALQDCFQKLCSSSYSE